MKPFQPALLLLACLFLTACGESNSSLRKWQGSDVTVHFRGDSLGVATPLGIGVATTWINGSMVSLDGNLVTAHPDGIYLDSQYKSNPNDNALHHAIFWIPTECILTVQMSASQ